MKLLLVLCCHKHEGLRWALARDGKVHFIGHRVDRFDYVLVRNGKFIAEECGCDVTMLTIAPEWAMRNEEHEKLREQGL